MCSFAGELHSLCDRDDLVATLSRLGVDTTLSQLEQAQASRSASEALLRRALRAIAVESTGGGVGDSNSSRESWTLNDWRDAHDELLNVVHARLVDGVGRS